MFIVPTDPNDKGEYHVTISIDTKNNICATVRRSEIVAQITHEIVDQAVRETRKAYNRSKTGWI